ncbi:MAG: hypothetical protein OXE74_01665 [Cyanobacteria bacterium MAG CAR2_bin_4]|nr:hypothetical protein [Cyanobacteria bacterium MAG CAR2_bin_4]
MQQRFSAPPLVRATGHGGGEDLSTTTPLAENEGAWSKLLGFETVSSPHLVTGSAFSFSPNHQHQQQKGRSRGKEHRN